jgi:hypothetical protein
MNRHPVYSFVASQKIKGIIPTTEFRVCFIRIYVAETGSITPKIYIIKMYTRICPHCTVLQWVKYSQKKMSIKLQQPIISAKERSRNGSKYGSGSDSILKHSKLQLVQLPCVPNSFLFRLYSCLFTFRLSIIILVPDLFY